MNSHDIGRGRGGVAAALRRVTAQTSLVAVDSDRLYPPYLSALMADSLPRVVSHTVIASQHGHDGFLVEMDQVGEQIARAFVR